MNIEELREYCIAKKAVTEELPFGPDTLVFKIGGKVFLLVGLDRVDGLSFNVKCDPEYAITLRQQHEQTVFPGYHMNKKHWNTVHANRQLNDQKLMELIDHSYDLVFASLTKAIKESLS
ncbi:MmcQ/YjbR family DNA-binding protein [Sphingobacterium sp. SRCM116780]|uniref:MmcQ/YjbR family DNA-binding protein n=1 Tax=Sphingobacterium sp. SRCM116780 TaxID=2907623 RepID=UPI001F43F6F6|nr:MmcQ/YjbR family DNA-binding protein [Sphingobacterium sp. SRCM116780]UIR56149.1 MmcQ/YjbR family DNA-binding protein [Sphingobacterium sp. SRCM116780]